MESSRYNLTVEMTPEELLTHIFEHILPGYEMPLRREQEEFALFILDSLLHRKLALAEAGVGTGKTHAYLIASIVYNLYTKQVTNCYSNFYGYPSGSNYKYLSASTIKNTNEKRDIGQTLNIHNPEGEDALYL